MCLAAKASVKKWLLKQESAKRLEKLIKNMQLPISLEIDSTSLFNAMKKDKKREGGEIHLILLENIGNAVVLNFTYKELEEIIYDLCGIKWYRFRQMYWFG